MNLEIKQLTPNYVRPLLDILSNNDSGKYFQPHPFTLDYISKLPFSKDMYCVVILDGKVIGYGMLRGWEEGYDIPMLGIYVDTPYRKNYGIGALLMSYMHAYARLKGCKQVKMKVHKTNTYVIEFHKKYSGYEFSDYNDELVLGIKNL